MEQFCYNSVLTFLNKSMMIIVGITILNDHAASCTIKFLNHHNRKMIKKRTKNVIH